MKVDRCRHQCSAQVLNIILWMFTNRVPMEINSNLNVSKVIILRRLILSIALHNWLTTEDNLSLMMTEGCGRVNIQMLGSIVRTL